MAFQTELAGLYRLYLRARIPLAAGSLPRRNRAELRFSVQRAACGGLAALAPPCTQFRVGCERQGGAGLDHSHVTALQVKNALAGLQRDLCLHLHPVVAKPCSASIAAPAPASQGLALGRGHDATLA